MDKRSRNSMPKKKARSSYLTNVTPNTSSAPDVPLECEGPPTEVSGDYSSVEAVQLFKDFNRLYEVQLISETAHEVKMNILNKWVEDLRAQNEMLVSTLSELEQEAVSRVANLESRLQSDASTIRNYMVDMDCLVMTQYNMLRQYKELQKKLEEEQENSAALKSEVTVLVDFILEGRIRGKWDHPELGLSQETLNALKSIDDMCTEDKKSEKYSLFPFFFLTMMSYAISIRLQPCVTENGPVLPSPFPENMIYEFADLRQRLYNMQIVQEDTDRKLLEKNRHVVKLQQELANLEELVATLRSKNNCLDKLLDTADVPLETMQECIDQLNPPKESCALEMGDCVHNNLMPEEACAADMQTGLSYSIQKSDEYECVYSGHYSSPVTSVKNEIEEKEQAQFFQICRAAYDNPSVDQGNNVAQDSLRFQIKQEVTPEVDDSTQHDVTYKLQKVEAVADAFSEQQHVQDFSCGQLHEAKDTSAVTHIAENGGLTDTTSETFEVAADVNQIQVVRYQLEQAYNDRQKSWTETLDLKTDIKTMTDEFQKLKKHVMDESPEDREERRLRLIALKSIINSRYDKYQEAREMFKKHASVLDNLKAKYDVLSKTAVKKPECATSTLMCQDAIFVPQHSSASYSDMIDTSGLMRRRAWNQ